MLIRNMNYIQSNKYKEKNRQKFEDKFYAFEIKGDNSE